MNTPDVDRLTDLQTKAAALTDLDLIAEALLIGDLDNPADDPLWGKCIQAELDSRGITA